MNQSSLWRSTDCVKSHLTRTIHPTGHCKEAEYATPNYTSLASGLFWAEGNQFVPDSGKAFSTPHPQTAEKNLERGPVPGKELWSGITFSSERLICLAGQTLFNQTFVLLLSLVIAFLPFEAPDPCLFLQLRMVCKCQPPGCLCVSELCGVPGHAHITTFAFLLLICLITGRSQLRT